MAADGDAVGSSTAFCAVLKKAGIECTIVTPDDFPEYLKWMKGAEEAISFWANPQECKRLIEEADLIFMLDHNGLKREGGLEPIVAEAKAERIMIDHHPYPEEVDYLISDTSASSTCELVYLVTEQIWGKEIIDEDIANSLYTGINTDTGGLSHNSSHPRIYRVIADLLELGLDKEYVYNRIFLNNTLSRLRLLGDTLLNKLTIHPEYPLAIIPITMAELEAYDYKEGDLEGVVNIPLSIAYVEVSILITQRKDKVKLSFRSRDLTPVNKWASKFFNGGGHLNAAGGQMELPINQVVDLVNQTADWFFKEEMKTDDEAVED